MFILRYIVELKTAPTFTATKQVSSEVEAESKIARLKKLNEKNGYIKYSCYKLYDRENKIIKTYQD